MGTSNGDGLIPAAAADFSTLGGWVVHAQFMDTMGSPFSNHRRA
jgi:hypothetical protein